ncbi:hypothetical protein SAMD00019534_015630 [Acytostelium subglobosum LB1]|uniref:hypothetical protein n=1 Tax=Acytostelium subglobosum LB1 TaxID=1410327 RepID=UPI000644ED0A|nr:hypothetical protein SAMD00019534_015630 [Acytostelium subglobosum LB1]GAM18388.1 hypothetical protein SAMD00019534_015630 [Acytostelium subglobosum LB1]|eukprot:XP_012757608.1 hypothetical protein SAMD00019534_015630 [Acytostelium subglobosum LB1]
MSVKVWYVTGCSNGIGKSLVQELLKSGAKVAGTSRSKQSLIEVFGEDNQNFLALEVDLTNDASVHQSILATTNKFGTIDVLVNNAGFGQVGSVEDLTDNDLQKNFEINFFAPLRLIRHVAPLMRAKKSGHIINVSSMGALVPYPCFSSYCATKSALNTATETLAIELKPFGVKAFSINPGAFKSDFFNPTKMQMPDFESSVYKEQYNKAFVENLCMFNVGDPIRLAHVFIKVVDHQGELPVHIYVGEDAHTTVRVKAQHIINDLDVWSHLTRFN